MSINNEHIVLNGSSITINVMVWSWLDKKKHYGKDIVCINLVTLFQVQFYYYKKLKL